MYIDYCDSCLTGSQSESDSLASDEGANDDNTDDELSKVVGGLEFAIDRQDTTDSKQVQKKEVTESKTEDKKPVEEDNKPPLHSLQSVSSVLFNFAHLRCGAYLRVAFI